MTAPAFPQPLPISAWVGLGVVNYNLFANPHTVVECGGAGYKRMPITLVAEADGVTASNPLTVEWPVAMSDWGLVVEAQIYDQPTGGVPMFVAPVAGQPTYFGMGGFGVEFYGVSNMELEVPQYSRVRLPSCELVATNSGRRAPTGFGTAFFGRYRYGTSAFISASSVLKLTFDPVYLCEAGTWSPNGPFSYEGAYQDTPA